MKITIVYDNELHLKNLRSGWGFSCLIESKDMNVLFDTGYDGSILLLNMNDLGIDPDQIHKVFLSHNHWDHVGGLPSLLSANPNVEVFVPSSFSDALINEIKARANTIVCSKPEIIGKSGNVKYVTTGVLGSDIKEQSLILETSKGLVVVTGCSHPGLENILEVARGFGEISAVIGGFHGFDKYKVLEGLSLIAPCHCTMHKREIKNMFPAAHRDCGVGNVIEI